MIKSPNAEQLKAIEHEGGVLLRAGAGSGKTFVLVEHIVYLTRKWINDYKLKPVLSFEEFIREKFSKVVMMTFTKKAAGEMNIRLTERFAEIVKAAEENNELWLLANESLPLLTVTTIDGFCKKLISSGYFPHLSTEAKIIFTAERTNQVRELVDKWFELRASDVDSDILDIVIREKNELLSAFCNVFSDPGLRLAWKSFSADSAHPSTLGPLLLKSYQLNDISHSLMAVHQLDLPHESEMSAFEKYVAQFQSLGLSEIDNVDKLRNHVALFEGKRLVGESAKKKTLSHEKAKDGLVALRDWSRKWLTVLKDYQNHYDSKVLPWMNLCLEIYHWIEERMDPNQGMTFGDIEYLVALGLENKADRERIQKTYSYFIVDEFQDTSALQFKIIQGLIGSDFNKLFCVGDAKQAIYGFRGGELSVFQDCGELVPMTLSLANNYRSLPEIISFNNSLFKTILPLGQEFSGHDPFSVDPEDQNIPIEVKHKEAGAIEIFSALLERDLENEGKFSNEDINRLEAELIASSIESERDNNPQNVCTVLYSKLRPSAELIRALMEKKIGFTAQFKIDLLDDPIIGMFLCLLRRLFDRNSVTKEQYPLFLIQSYLNVLGIKQEVSAEKIKNFDLNVQYWGLLEGFRKFLHDLAITVENADISIQTIETLAELYHQDPEAVMIQLIQGDNPRISLDLRSGANAHMVQIMTAHASKGLEFDIVYLGGIYTNGRDQSDGGLFGNMPGSFNWYIDLSQREKQKSPYYVFESELSKYKNFSEAKRLFYVACTRAKKKLVWIDFDIPEKTFSIPRNSWIDGLRAWFSKGLSPDCMDSVKIVKKEDFDSKAMLNSKSLPQLPLFFHDSVGIFSKGEGRTELAITAELSVTRLNSLIDCPRKFYLENILKLTPTTEVKQVKKELLEEEGDSLLSTPSSADRGTYIHAQIATGIERNFIVPREAFSSEQRAPVQWALDLLKDKTGDYDLIAEKTIKFKFFNFMISGIPDLLLLPISNQSAQVWDFKTGRITEESLKHYWLQLSTYAYALYQLGRVDKALEIKLVLCFVDQQKLQEKTITWSDCVKELYPLWVSQNAPWKINADHCSQCFYGDICPR
jgi:ATP-dependent helicase/nuclease subunit A